jgi:hypothetical protein
MSSDAFPYPVAVSQLCESDSGSDQCVRAIKWLYAQKGGPIVVVTPNKRINSKPLDQLVSSPGVTHLTWRGLHSGSLTSRRVLFAWPDRPRLNDLWGAEPDALVVIEWGSDETAEWVEDAYPTRLLPMRELKSQKKGESVLELQPLPEDVAQILEDISFCAAGYDSGLKWNEEDKLKADMMNSPNRWARVTVEQVRAKCRSLNMRPNDVDKVVGYLQRRKDGGRFNVRSSYKGFRFL